MHSLHILVQLLKRPILLKITGVVWRTFRYPQPDYGFFLYPNPLFCPRPPTFLPDIIPNHFFAWYHIPPILPFLPPVRRFLPDFTPMYHFLPEFKPSVLPHPTYIYFFARPLYFSQDQCPCTKIGIFLATVPKSGIFS